MLTLPAMFAEMVFGRGRSEEGGLSGGRGVVVRECGDGKCDGSVEKMEGIGRFYKKTENFTYNDKNSRTHRKGRSR